MASKSAAKFALKVTQVGATKLVQVVLRQFTQDGEGSVFITPEMTDLELDETIDGLKQELEQIRAKAKVILK